MSKQRQTLTQRIVEDLIEKHNLRNSGMVESAQPYGANEVVWELIRDEVRMMKPATLGIIAANGPGHRSPAEKGTSLYSVHCGTWLSKYDTGRNLLRDIATTALMALIHDRLKAENEVWDILDDPELDFLQEE